MCRPLSFAASFISLLGSIFRTFFRSVDYTRHDVPWTWAQLMGQRICCPATQCCSPGSINVRVPMEVIKLRPFVLSEIDRCCSFLGRERTRFWGEINARIFNYAALERKRKRGERHRDLQGCHISDMAFLRGLYFDPEDGSKIFRRNFGWLWTNYTELYPRKQTFSVFNNLSRLSKQIIYVST